MRMLTQKALEGRDTFLLCLHCPANQSSVAKVARGLSAQLWTCPAVRRSTVLWIKHGCIVFAGWTMLGYPLGEGTSLRRQAGTVVPGACRPEALGHVRLHS